MGGRDDGKGAAEGGFDFVVEVVTGWDREQKSKTWHHSVE